MVIKGDTFDEYWESLLMSHGYNKDLEEIEYERFIQKNEANVVW